jgi:homoserine O-succinyltransferase
MPIIIPEQNCDDYLYSRLNDAGSALINENEANHQDLRPARIGLLNLMPAPVMENTELRWLQFISHTVLQIEPVLVKFDNDQRENPGSSRRKILERYSSFSEVKEKGLDGLIITGDNREIDNNSLLEYENIYYGDDLSKVIDWSENNVTSTIFSCLASHFALYKRHGIKRNLSHKKLLGVYSHEVLSRESELTFAIDDTISSPHSRWASIDYRDLLKKDIGLIALNEDVGWLLADEKTEKSYNVYLQGHPEYWRNDLANEFLRDNSQLPENYFPNDNPQKTPKLTWSNDSRTLLSNWISYIYKSYSI